MKHGKNAIREVFIDFQSSQISVRTNMSEIEQFVRESHAPMIVSSAPKLISTIDVMRLDAGFRLGDDVINAEGEPSVLFDLLRQTIQSEFVAAHTEMMWMHSGAVAENGAAILVAGVSTAGKSTLVTHLVENGLSYMTDELVGVCRDGTVTGFPRMPIRRTRSDRELTQLETNSLVRETVRVSATSIQRKRASMRAIVFCKYKHGAETELQSLSTSDAAVSLLKTLLNFSAQKDAAVSTVASIARTVPAYSLVFSDAVDATQSILREM